VGICRGVLVDVSGSPIEAMLSRHSELRAHAHYAPTLIGQRRRQTLDVRAVIVATSRLSDQLAYEITKAVFDNFEDFRRLHPRFLRSCLLTTSSMSPARLPSMPGRSDTIVNRDGCRKRR
jgi:TRAP-type uncharacterized transport system substrate-binding protein